MIIDAHVHVFPDQAGAKLGRSPEAQCRLMQNAVGDYWGRMVTSHTERSYIPSVDEDVEFRVAPYGRWTWKKNDGDCWLQRGTPSMAVMEHPPEQMIATLDSAGVDVGVIHTDVDYVDVKHGRENYFLECIRKWGDRLVGTVRRELRLASDRPGTGAGGRGHDPGR